MAKILLVEDDKDLAQSLYEYLTGEGCQVVRASTAGEARKLGPSCAELVILDWMLPDIPGIDLLREWR